MISTKLISVTPNAEETMVYIARVSSPKSEVEKRKDPHKLLSYCMRNGHWSVFEHAHATIEVNAPRWLTTQLLRHWSFSFSEFSQRYAEAPDTFFISECRMQDTKNRQSSLPCDDATLAAEWDFEQREVWEYAYNVYTHFLNLGVAKEVARNILPMGTMSKIYMTGSIRSWVHYCEMRTHESTQKEHREVAEQCREILKAELPNVFKETT